MDFKKVKVSDRDLILKYYTPERAFGAHQNFTSMYIWQDGYHIGYDIVDGFLCVTSRHHRMNPYYVFPEGDGDPYDVICKIIDFAHSKGEKCVFSQLSEKEMEYLQERFPGVFTYEEHRHSAEYVYEVEKMISLSGKKLHSKRNHLNSFLASYDFEYSDINDKNLKQAWDFCLKSLEGHDDRAEEKISIDKLFGDFEALCVSGGVITIDGKIIAVTVGEMLNTDTALIHLEKADTDYQGSYAAINNLYLKNKFADVKYVNREEDMGIEGLRKAKLSYHPCFLVSKHIAVEV